MNEQPPAAGRENAGTVARIIHGAVAGGLAVAFAVFLYLRSLMAIEFPAEGARGIRLVGYIVLGSAIVVAQMLRTRIRSPGREDDVSAWWTDNLPKAVLVWAVAEGGGLAVLVLGWVIGDATLLAFGVAVGLALLFVNRPSRLETVL
jgi:hypothetical protein